jgi:hypothetical protein
MQFITPTRTSDPICLCALITESSLFTACSLSSLTLSSKTAWRDCMCHLASFFISLTLRLWLSSRGRAVKYFSWCCGMMGSAVQWYFISYLNSLCSSALHSCIFESRPLYILRSITFSSLCRLTSKASVSLLASSAHRRCRALRQTVACARQVSRFKTS